jgi:hypothetical protein
LICEREIAIWRCRLLGNQENDMVRVFLLTATAGLLACGSPVLAKGCLKGAAVGGVGGHMVGKGHGMAGAAIGCAVGHHRAAKAAKARQ